jgi:hypothetical protein
MKNESPKWGQQSRFYLPNEDAQMLRMALACLPQAPQKLVFVGGSGMVLLDAMADLPKVSQVTFVDISEFQVAYFRSLFLALENSKDPEELMAWFVKSIHPQLHQHFLSVRKQVYSLERVIEALQELFRIRFFFEPDVFNRVKESLGSVQSVERDIVSYLVETREEHDFIYLSNVPDYLPEFSLPTLFEACSHLSAPVYLLLTEACPDPSAVRKAWEVSGFIQHTQSAEMTEQNCGLGSYTLQRSWNRKGRIVLLMPRNI